MPEDSTPSGTSPVVALERAGFPGTIHVVSTVDELSAAYEGLSQKPVLGFDTETRPRFVKGQADRSVAIVQFATADEAWIIRTSILQLPEPLCALFASERIVKVGLAVHEDLRRLRHFHPLEVANVVDLQRLAKAAGYTELGLKALTAKILGLGLSKAARLSNWEAENLSEPQQRYAATDAWICREMYKKLMSSEKINIEESVTIE